MCARLLACPLCSQPGFLTLDALRTGLISVATRPLTCPVCNEVLLGIDKLTIHLFSHTINLNNNNVTEPSKYINITSNNNSAVIHSVQNTVLQDWDASKVQIVDSNRLVQNDINIQNGLISSQSLRNAKSETSSSKSGNSVQDRNCTSNHISQVTLNQESVSGNKMIDTIHKSEETEAEKCSRRMLHETIKLNYSTQYYTDENVKHTNCAQNYPETEHENIETFKSWLQGQHCEQQNNDFTNKIEGSEENTKCFDDKQNYNEQQVATMNKFSNFATAYNNMLLERANEQNIQETSSRMRSDSHNESFKHEEILPQLKFIKSLTTKEKTERCNICGFHFLDHDILLLHKQLVHTINEKDLNVAAETFLKNYSCHLCSKVFKMRGSLMVHMRVAHMGYNLGSLAKGGQIELVLNENKYSCPTCGKKFKKEQHVIQHLKTHEAKQWECDVCSKMFTTKYFLKKHKRLHSGEMPYKCNICNKTFTFQQSYHKHRLYHKDDKPHTCATCGRSFKELSTLHNHERIHTGEKPFACETCGKCFRQRVSYLVHRRIHTGVMPYKCTTCGKSFRYKVSQRTHKCPTQQIGNVQQTNAIDQSVHLSNIQGVSNDLCKSQKEFSREDQPMLNIINNDENKYVLIINTQGQHLLTKESNVEKLPTVLSNEQKLEKHIGLNNKDEQMRTTWKSDIPNDIIFKKSHESSKIANSKNDKPVIENTNDFFSMVISPLENGLSSPTTEMEHLRVSSPTEEENILKPYGAFSNATSGLEMNLINTNIGQSYTNSENNANNLQTINEESFKQLLYSINEK